MSPFGLTFIACTCMEVNIITGCCVPCCCLHIYHLYLCSFCASPGLIVRLSFLHQPLYYLLKKHRSRKVNRVFISASYEKQSLQSISGFSMLSEPFFYPRLLTYQRDIAVYCIFFPSGNTWQFLSYFQNHFAAHLLSLLLNCYLRYLYKV